MGAATPSEERQRLVASEILPGQPARQMVVCHQAQREERREAGAYHNQACTDYAAQEGQSGSHSVRYSMGIVFRAARPAPHAGNRRSMDLDPLAATGWPVSGL